MAVYDSAAAADLFTTKKRSNASGPWRGGVSGRVARSWCSFERETRGCAGGGDDSAGTVRFMISDPLQRPQSTRRNLNSSEASTGVSIRLQRGSASIRVQIRPRLSAFRTVCYSRLPCRMPSSQGTARRSATRVSLGLPPSFPQLWKKMWKSQGFRPGSAGRPRWYRGFHGAKAQNRPVSWPRDVIAG